MLFLHIYEVGGGKSTRAPQVSCTVIFLNTLLERFNDEQPFIWVEHPSFMGPAFCA